jgi:hypothetical protein
MSKNDDIRVWKALKQSSDDQIIVVGKFPPPSQILKGDPRFPEPRRQANLMSVGQSNARAGDV